MPKSRPAEFVVETSVDGDAILEQIERFARTCYKSEGKIGPGTASPFVGKLLRTFKHEGILDHHSISVRFVIDRGVSHELVRHRIAAYLQESTRYCDYSKAGEIEVISPAAHMNEEQFAEWMAAMQDAERHYNKLRSLGCSPQMARAVLPNSLKTEIVATMNLTSWRNFFKKRTDVRAHPQMREVAIPLLVEFKRLVPVVFDDIDAGGGAR